MLNEPTEVNLIEQARESVATLLAKVPWLRWSWVPPTHQEPMDLVVEAEANGKAWRLLFEVKAQAQPRQVRNGVEQLKRFLANHENTYGIFVGPHLSPESKSICTKEGVGFLDLIGNCHLAFDHILIDRDVEQTRTAKKEERRTLRSIFGRQSSKAMRLLLKEPDRLWRVAELAKAARISTGQVSYIRTFLLDEEWAVTDAVTGALRISQPGSILEAWREIYARERQERKSYYTILFGSELKAAIATALADGRDGHDVLLRSYSAAEWIAPYSRYTTERFFVTPRGEEVLRRHLKLESTTRGENVRIIIPKDTGVFDDRIDAGNGIWCTGIVQTYLDLWSSGERGQEAAEYLRHQKFDPIWRRYDR